MTKKSISAAILPVLIPGTHTAMDGRSITVTASDCVDMASHYDPTLCEAPFVLGHPKLTAPAYGWAKRFEMRDGMLWAEPKQVNKGFAEAFNSGAIKKRSLAFWLPNSPGNPKPGHYYPRHVGFLGAVHPAVKGLPDVQFAHFDEYTGDDAPVEFAMDWFDPDLLPELFSGLRDYLIEKEGVGRANVILPDYRLNRLTELMKREFNPDPVMYAEETDVEKENTPADAPAEFAEREAALAERENTLVAREKALRESEEKARRDAIAEFAGELVSDGRILPRQKNAVVEVLSGLSCEPVAFSDGSNTISETPEALLREILSTKPAVVEFAEKSPTGDAPVEFADAGALALAASEYQTEQAAKGNFISVTDAVNHVKGGQK